MHWSTSEKYINEDLRQKLESAVDKDYKHIVSTVIVGEDVGGPFAVMKRIELVLWSDFTVTWGVPEIEVDDDARY